MTEANKAMRIAAIMLLFVVTAGICYAEVFRPLQILLPGNLGGNLASIDRDLKIKPDLCWRITEQVASFKRLKDKDSLVIAPGNDSNIYSPFNYLFRGELERELIGHCHPDVRGISPDDLEMFADSGLSKEIRQHVWTNHETIDNQMIFAPFACLKTGNQRIWYFNFISAEYCRSLPLSNWGNFAAENPKRSLRRLAPDLTDTDITISTVYLGQYEIEQLAAELKNMPGWHLIIQVATANTPALYSTTMAQQNDNLWFLTIADGHRSLPQINIFRRNNGWPRLTVRQLAFSKISGRKGEELFQQAEKKCKAIAVKPLRVIRPSFQASTSAFRFADKQHARLIRQVCNSDVTFLRVPQMQHMVDNVICTGHIFASMENDRIHSFRLSGKELFELAAALVKDSDTEPTAVAGCEVTWFAGRISTLKISGQPCRSDRQYLVSTSERTLRDPALMKLTFYDKLQGYEGMTLWKAWMNSLKSLQATDEQLIDQTDSGGT
ncbi:MAG: hypothetical protein GQF41_2292 [Candidatus Rifleibacterium amylolyticum]|nr:MAG: hypothetical protein GQF41_2292 [Candidatus Rifleibacterium amylolyticum]